MDKMIGKNCMVLCMVYRSLQEGDRSRVEATGEALPSNQSPQTFLIPLDEVAIGWLQSRSLGAAAKKGMLQGQSAYFPNKTCRSVATLQIAYPST